jgi:malate dehydrogenase (oxaloacetate-decarboxylating)
VYTGKGRTVALVSDGSAVLGQGSVGPAAALATLESTALLFKECAGIDAVPLALAVYTDDEFIAAVSALTPSFGCIVLCGVASSRASMAIRTLAPSLDVPILHEDTHGTAVSVLACLINAHKVVRKDIATSRIVVIGAGSAGIATAHLLCTYGVGDITVLDHDGILGPLRTNLTPLLRDLAACTNREARWGGMLEALTGADAVVGLSGPRAINLEHVRMMAQRPIVCALAQPVPEILPGEAEAAGAKVVATGRPDFANHVHGTLALPGIVRGVLDRNVRTVTESMLCGAAEKLASLVRKPREDLIVPDIFDRRLVKAVASAIR